MSKVDTTGHSASTPHPPPDQPNAPEATAREPSAASQSAGSATPSKPIQLVLMSSPGPVMLPSEKAEDFKVAVRDWGDSAIDRLGASTDDAEREAIRQEAIRVAAVAQAFGREDAEKLAQEIIMRVNRAIGLANPRRSGGRPKRGDDSGRAAATRANNRPTGRTVSAAPSGGDETSGEKTPHPGGRELSRSTKADYRQDAEALSDTGFERVAEAVRDTPGAEPMSRRLVRAAGEVEKAGGDPASVVGGPLPASKAKKRSRARGGEDSPDVQAQAQGRIAVGNVVPGDEARRNTAHVEASARRIAPADLHCAPVNDLSKAITAGSVDAVVTAVSDRAAAVAVRDFAAHALRPGGVWLALVVPEILYDVMPSIAGGELGYRWTSAVLTTESRNVPAAHVGGSRCVFAVVCTRADADPRFVDEAESPRPLPELLAAWVTSHGVVCDPCCGDGPVLAAALELGFRCIGATADEQELERVRQSLSISASGETPLSPSTSRPRLRQWLWSRVMKQ